MAGILKKNKLKIKLKIKMKEKDKDIICEWLDRFVASIEKSKSNSIAHLEQFKKDNNLLKEDKLNKWLVNDEHPEWIVFADGKKLFYGTDIFGNYFYYKKNKYTPMKSDRIATESEVQERLTKFAVKLGYKEKQSECLSDDDRRDIDLSNSCFTLDEDNTLWIEDNETANCIMKDGIWAKFIQTEKEQLLEEIERLKEKVSKLKG